MGLSAMAAEASNQNKSFALQEPNNARQLTTTRRFRSASHQILAASIASILRSSGLGFVAKRRLVYVLTLLARDGKVSRRTT